MRNASFSSQDLEHDAATLEPVATVDLPRGGHIVDLKMSPSGDRLYALRHFESAAPVPEPPAAVLVIDPATRKLIHTIPYPNPRSIDVSPDGRRLWLVQNNHGAFDQLVAFDTENNFTELVSLRLDKKYRYRQVMVHRNGQPWVLGTTPREGTVSQIDGDTGKVIRTVPFTGMPVYLASLR
ncbi:hypothetical protein GCM10022267_91040 [Lentzea roselyniae]|uniref:40-residue YVTN family beta-propeller repeat-containing protein n=1 Tax=Lentzea roselyniae TaxID=531940 RepID=A0ABP7CL08_9PSEU